MDDGSMWVGAVQITPLVILMLVASSVDGQQTIPCDVTYMFRTFDGTCGNLTNPLLGSAGTAYTRMFPATYFDGYIIIYLINILKN